MTTDRKFAQFDGIVNDLEEFRDVMGEAMPQALVKVVDHLDDVCRDYIASSSFCLLAWSDPGGVIDISLKGDPAGFVCVLDD